ncbi:MAG: 2-succinyl-5-enolpyruvyl-6-hydroxy-3-cyclohexene-1-carboxylic-acid synthase [Prolixibacteraceae bacterium]|nr:2-succinyl-5-enolpyruvyl-6-hydroxy-3-cyclohexene-1-carboxylic-acid synthase [Prolixibacteraceae bacterium]
MIHHLQHIADLVEICRKKNIKHVIVSPGSRNAPLIRQFFSDSFFNLHSIVDERSAAFYGLGVSLATHEPVVLVCTSGSAGLNYAPALAEAFYQRVPLIAVTADRPPWLIGQQDNQAIHQVEVFRNFVKCSINVDIPIKDEQRLVLFHQNLDSLLNCAVNDIKGPVHVNVPVDEPLYAEMPEPSRSIKLKSLENQFFSGFNMLKEYWKKSRKPIIVVGQQNTGSELCEILNRLGVARKTVVLAEPLANIAGRNVIGAVDRVMMQVELSESEEKEMYRPDLLVSVGGHVVSKRLKNWLHNMDIPHFRISEKKDGIDTYGNLTENIVGDPASELFAILSDIHDADAGFLKVWHEVNDKTLYNHNSFLKEAEFSDIKVFYTFLKKIPDGAAVHFGNSSPIRYGQLFELGNMNGVFANRGVSGIDGCLSTAAGYASQTNLLTFVFVGDLSFVYDSNAMWNRNLPSNLRIIMINNSGGGIFRLLDGPLSFDGFNNYIETSHPVNIGKIVESFGLAYFFGKSVEGIDKQIEDFVHSNKPAVFEVKTPQLDNPVVYRKYLETIKQK